MVSIPSSWNRFNQVVDLPPKKSNQNSAHGLTDRYHKLQEQSAFQTAKEEGYFFSVTNDYLVEHFCHEKYTDFKTIHYIRYALLNSMRLREITCISFAMRLRICDLSCNFITKLDPLGTCRQLIKLDVHSNQIMNIPNHHFWGGLKNLKILHLHDNPLSKMDTLQFLANCRRLEILTLYDTPLHLRRNYRHHAVNTIFTLTVLDRHLVSDGEIIEDAQFGRRFGPLSPYLEIETNAAPTKRSSDYAAQLAAYHRTLTMVNRRLARNSPVLIIQRYFRGYTTRKRYRFVMETKLWAATSIQRWWRQNKGLELTAPPPSRERARSQELSNKPSPSPALPRITINLNKLNASAIEPLANEQLLLESELMTFRSDAGGLQKPPLPAPMMSPRRVLPTVEQPRRPAQLTRMGTTFPYLNPYGSLEVAEEQGDLPRVHFRLSGVKTQILSGDAVNQMVVQNIISGQHVRDADTDYHRGELYNPKTKIAKQKFVNNDQRYFSKVQGTMNLSCLLAVNRAYQERDRAEMSLAKIEKIMTMRDERIASKRRIEAEKDEKRRRIIMERQKDKLRALESLEQQQLHSLHYIYKSQELRQRAQHFRRTTDKEHTFATDFQNQQTSISNALLRHDRQSSMETRQKSLIDFVTKHRDEELEQRDLIRKYLEHRKAMRQTEVTLANAELDTKIVQESSDRLKQAHARVDQLRALRQRAKEYCPLPDESVKTIPHDDRTGQRAYGLDKWNTTISVQSGRVGKHHIEV